MNFSFDLGWFTSDTFKALLASLGFLIGGDPVEPPVVNPAEGTVLETRCVGTTLQEDIADGLGSFTTRETENSEQCGYVEPPPNPPAGTILLTGCSKEYPGVQWFRVADGEGGYYTEKDPQSRECGWEPPTMTLTLLQNEGDRFKPVIVEVDYRNFLGEKEGWGMKDVTSTIGEAIRPTSNPDTIRIYGDGRLGDGILSVGRNEIQFRMVEEPTCDVETGPSGTATDCQGYSISRSADDQIYYGEDDTRLVVWEYSVLEYISHRNDPEIESGILEWYPAYDETDNTGIRRKWEKWQRRVDDMNDLLKNSGVHIYIELVQLGQGHYHGLRELERIMQGQPTDVVIGYGTSNPDTCGIAYPNKYFREGEPVVGMSRCSWKTDLHELGHAVGLAHGPENQAYQARGYIFPQFGHGWNDYCGRQDDIMSYGYDDNGFGNSRQTCGDQYPDSRYAGNLEQAAGDRGYHDSAYHLNRVRYDVSLIHDENKYVDPDESRKVSARPSGYDIEKENRPLIVD